MASTPSTAPSRTLPSLPDVGTPSATLPEPDVVGGGPLGGGDPDAVKRVHAQLPSSPQDIEQVDGAAIAYADKLIQFVPTVATAFNAIKEVASCGVRYGVLAAKAYITRDRTAAGAIVVLSRDKLQQLPRIALNCFADKLVSGGGPGAFSPCITRYYYERITEGVADGYYVLAVGTHSRVCDVLFASHSPFKPRAW